MFIKTFYKEKFLILKEFFFYVKIMNKIRKNIIQRRNFFFLIYYFY